MLNGFEFELIFLILIVIQSIVGVGILVIGTPALLILEYNIIDIYLLLLPVSILTSVLNVLIIKFSQKNFEVNFDIKTKKNFFLVCLPSVLIGLMLLKEYQAVINFKYLVSFIIIFSIFFVNLVKKKIFKLKLFHSILIGIVHGVTNSGGTLLSLFFSKGNNKNSTRYIVSFFYLFLALFQYFMTLFIFDIKNFYLSDYKSIPILLTIGIILGNYTVKYINFDKFKLLVNILAITTCCVLIFT